MCALTCKYSFLKNFASKRLCLIFNMADRFKFMAMNAPIDVLPIDMGFGFRQDLTIDEFLNKINLPHLFHNVAYWQGAQFKLVVHGQDQEGRYLDRECDLVVETHEHTLAEWHGVVRQ